MNQQPISSDQLNQSSLVATFAMSFSAQNYFNQLRRQHFPAERNHLDAHLTLFHALPPQSWIIEDMKKLVKNQEPFIATAQNIVSLGNGTAIKIISPNLALIHQILQKKWFDVLSAQDRQRRNFHITIQNKVESQTAKKLQAEITVEFKPFDFMIEGIQLWRYMNGPWEFQNSFDFGS